MAGKIKSIIDEKIQRTFIVKTSMTQEEVYTEDERKKGETANVNGITNEQGTATEKKIKNGELEGKHMENVVEIQNMDVLKEFKKEMSKDNGKGGDKAAQNREYGAYKNEGGEVTTVAPGSIKKPMDPNASVNFPGKAQPDPQSGQYSLNHEAGHFVYWAANSTSYYIFVRKVREEKRDYKGGHTEDNPSGKKAKEYGSIKNDGHVQSTIFVHQNIQTIKIN